MRPAESGAGDLREANAVLASDFADQRGGAGFFFLFVGSGGWRGGRRCGGCGLLFFRSFFFRLFLFGLSCGGSSGLCGSACGFAICRDGSDDGVDVYRGAFGDFDFLEDAGGWGGDLGVDFVGGDFEERFVALNFVARLFQPLGNSALNDGFAHLGHDDVCGHEFLPRGAYRLKSRAGRK